MKIFLVRHGETDYGKKQYTTGHIDIPLNDTGKKEALATANFLKGKAISKIFSSSLIRAIGTANIIASELKLPVVEYDELIEHTSGKLDGVPLKEFFETLRKVGDFDKMIQESGGEPWQDYVDRVWRKFLEIVNENSGDESILIVTHGGVTRTIFGKIMNVPFPNAISQGNCCVNLVSYDHKRADKFHFLIELVNYTYHLE
jgi:broad specificity phosphatase PhoE